MWTMGDPTGDSSPREGEALTVGQVASRYGVTVRTLHHYDSIGLVVPSGRSRAGYREYEAADLDRLTEVVVYRRLGFGLDEIGHLLAAQADGADVTAHLRRQREVVMDRLGELKQLVQAIDTALEARMNGYQISKDEQRELFGDAFDDDYAVEAEQRWGDSPAWAESQRRARSYSKAQWEQIKAEQEASLDALAAAYASGEAATSVTAMDAAEQARAHIDRWFYAVSPAMHAALGEMYVADPRFAQTYESRAQGLAQFVRDAIVANADRSTPGRGL